MTAIDRGYTSCWWGTRNQINALGGHIRAGQNRANGKGATYITVWSERPADADEGASGYSPPLGARRPRWFFTRNGNDAGGVDR
jgi:N-terminal domain of anti-restriction factor ArdC